MKRKRRKRRKRLKPRNPVARAVRRLRPRVVPSARTYRRRPKHGKRAAPDIDPDGLSLL